MNRIRSIVICTPVRLARRFSHVRTNRRRGESNRALNLRADNRRTESDALDPMFEKPQKAQVVRIKIEAISLNSTSIAPSLDGPLLADSVEKLFKTWSTRFYRG